MNDLEALGAFVYGYCTDFVINLANLLGLSYYEVNALLFVFLWPLLTVVLLLIFAKQEVLLARLRRAKEKSAGSRT